MTIEQLQHSPNEYALTTPKETSDLFKGMMNGVQVEKKFVAGEKIPFSFAVNGDTFHLDKTSEHTLEITHDFFVRFSESDLLFSLDGEHWGDFTEIFTGSLGFHTELSEDNPILNGELVANMRT